MRRLPFLILAAFALAISACGDDGGGNEEAFCDSLDSLSDQVGDGDLSDDDGLDDVTDTVNELLEVAADGEQLDAVRVVGEEVQEADPADADDVAEVIQDELGGFADDCRIDDFAIAPTTTGTTDTTDTSDTTDTTAGDDRIPVAARAPVPAGIAPEFAGLAQACFEGDFEACDELFRTTPVDSVDEEYGDTCGGRAPGGIAFCTTIFPGPQPPPAGVADAARAGACFDGDMGACDDLLDSGNDADRQYGFFCGGRIDNEVADTDQLCVAIFGDVAFD